MWTEWLWKLSFVNFQPLMECYVNLREKGTAINIHLTETWWRHYQVSPSDYEYYHSSPEVVLVYLMFLWFPLLTLLAYSFTLPGWERHCEYPANRRSQYPPPPFSPRLLHCPPVSSRPSRPWSDPICRSLVTGYTVREKLCFLLKNTIQALWLRQEHDVCSKVNSPSHKP